MPARLSPEILQQVASQRGGKCLSATYINVMSDYLWECGTCRKQWKASLNNVKNQNSWCPHCKVSVREQVVRAAFQECLPGEEFATDRTTIGMELDGYCSRYRIAFEHDGEQHRVRVPHFQRTEEAFLAQQMRDRRKDDLCEQAWITLIRVPDRGVLPLKNIRAYVRAQLAEALDIAPMTCDDKEFLDRAAATAHYTRSYVPEIQATIEKKGVLLSQICPTRDYIVTVRCQSGHEFTTNYDNLESGRWCPTCAPNRKLQDSDLERIVQEAGLEFLGVLSRKSSNGRARRYICLNCPHHGESEQLLDNFRKRRACAECAKSRKGRRADPSEVQKKIIQAGFRLVDSYVNNSTPSTFECLEHAHRFIATYQNVLREGAECPGCIAARAVPLILEELPREPFKMLEKYRWRCSACGTVSDTTIRGIKIRIGKTGRVCNQKTCPSNR